jgi:nicotinate phosphoribosyltransferase
MGETTSFDPHHSALFTDLYELTMLQAYYAERMTGLAVFELFFRELPSHRNYVMAAGLDDVLTYLEHLRFSDDELAWLRRQQQCSDACLRQLADLRFTGDVYAVPEGTIVFENEPVIQVVAPMPEAQLIETYVLNQIHLQSVAATKASRVVIAAQGRTVVDFGSRRAHGSDAALKVARVSYLAGAAGTSNVAASKRYGVPAFGTMAHSYVQAHASEMEALQAFTREFPETTLLVDTYDTLAGVQKVIDLARRLGGAFKVRAIRLDSGDLAHLAKQSRRLLDDAGLHEVRIFASSSLDEYRLADLLAAGAPIDGFGVGTKLAVSEDAPEIDFSYKLVAYDDQPRMKLSSSKLVRPGRKQVFRRYAAGCMLGDSIARHDEPPNGEPLLQAVMHRGKRLEAGRVTLDQAREHASAQLQALPDELKRLERVEPGYPIDISDALRDLTWRVQHALERECRTGD